MHEVAWQTYSGLARLESACRPAKCTAAQRDALLALARAGAATLTELAHRLAVNRSTASRAVAPLVQRLWIHEGVHEGDHRRRVLRLTGAGRGQVERLQRALADQLEHALLLLAPDDRARAAAGLALAGHALERARSLAEIEVRRIQPRDDRELARVLRAVMEEFGIVGPGTAHADPELDRMSAAYSQGRAVFFVARRQRELLGGGGIGPLRGADPEVCELRKMYLVGHARGIGLGNRLLLACLEAARTHGYRRCYLETMDRLAKARHLYEQHGFMQLEAPLGDTGHCRCGQWYVKDLCP